MSTLEDDFEPRLTAEELRQIRDEAAENAKALGLSDVEWQQVRRHQGRLLADILMACNPQLPWSGRPMDRKLHRARLVISALTSLSQNCEKRGL